MGINFYKVDFKYDRRSTKNTLDNINLTINAKGEFIAILGHTGSGKSTLIQHMNALLLPNYGEVEVFDQRIYPQNKKKLKGVRQKVGLVFQFPEYQLFEESVLKDVMFGPLNFGLDEESAKERALHACQLVGLDEQLYDRSPFSLSGGQMRRVAIAGILASDPDILILDEPTVGLDPRGKKDLMNLLTDIHKTTKKTVIIVSHDMNYVARYANRLIVLKEGKIVFDGNKEKLFNDFKHLKDFNLDLPESARIAEKLKEKGYIDYKMVPLTVEELESCIVSSLGDKHE